MNKFIFFWLIAVFSFSNPSNSENNGDEIDTNQSKIIEHDVDGEKLNMNQTYKIQHYQSPTKP